MKYIVLI